MKITTVITWILMIIMIATNAVSIYLTIEYKKNVNDNINLSITNKIESLGLYDMIDYYIEQEISSIVIKDGIDGRNGTDGINGLNGVNGQDGINGINGVDGINGNDGLTPFIRCNKDDNRWEIRYNDYDNWSLLNNEEVACTISEG